MKTSFILSVLASTIALAAPTSDVEKRADTAVLLCTDRNFKDYCAHITSASEKSVNFDSALNDQVSSVRPDKGSFCYFFV